jgi:hypothetical protein
MNPTLRDIIQRGWSMGENRPTFDEIFNQLVAIGFKLRPDVDSSRVTQFMNSIEM